MAIAAIVVVGRILVTLLRVITRFVVYCDWGPLGLVYRSNKNRAMTIHSLVFNLLKYISMEVNLKVITIVSIIGFLVFIGLLIWFFGYGPGAVYFFQNREEISEEDLMKSTSAPPGKVFSEEERRVLEEVSNSLNSPESTGSVTQKIINSLTP